jgi:hypothetical protein
MVTKDATYSPEPEPKKVEHGGKVIADRIIGCFPMLLISKLDRVVTVPLKLDSEGPHVLANTHSACGYGHNLGTFIVGIRPRLAPVAPLMPCTHRVFWCAP